MNISIISVGKLKEKYLKEAVAEYSKRLSRYCRLEIIEVPDEKAPENASDKEEFLIKEKEGAAILKHVKDNMHVVVLDLKGKMLSSEEFSKYIDDCGVKGESNIAFIIGGSLGLSQDVLKRADFSISFSRMTFPHQLMRVILLEQIYRGYRIMSGEPYHK
ncbi:MAG: 23S rRNA (pseudouridine(1915)-N(3))-methyltransferase RlmH [Clostridiaceae bacterium]